MTEQEQKELLSEYSEYCHKNQLNNRVPKNIDEFLQYRKNKEIREKLKFILVNSARVMYMDGNTLVFNANNAVAINATNKILNNLISFLNKEFNLNIPEK
jgi:hypothetical protein